MPKRANLPFVEGPPRRLLWCRPPPPPPPPLVYNFSWHRVHVPDATGTRYTHYTITALYIIYKYIYIHTYIWAAGGHVRSPKYRPPKRPDEQHYIYPGACLPPPHHRVRKLKERKYNKKNKRPRTTGLSFDYYWCGPFPHARGGRQSSIIQINIAKCERLRAPDV